MLGVVWALLAGLIAALLFVDYATLTLLSPWFWIAALVLGNLHRGSGVGRNFWGFGPCADAPAPGRGCPHHRPHRRADADLQRARRDHSLPAWPRCTGSCPPARQRSTSPSCPTPGTARARRAEEAALRRLLAEAGQGGAKIYYRRRAANTGRKAGNIAEFICRSGAAWDFALVLDADSLMEAETILTMIRRMEAAPDLALLQSLPRVVRARSIFGRAMQFAATFHGPVFTRGAGPASRRSTRPYWGHKR